MKKAFAILLALALAFSMAIFSFAEETSNVAADFQKITQELLATVSPEDLSAAVKEAADGIVPVDFDLENDDLVTTLSDDEVNTFADKLIAGLNLEGTDIATQIQEAMSGDFVSFLASLYCGPVEETTTAVATTVTATQPEKKPIETGSSNTVALAAFAALTVMAGAAFVCLKKKED